MVFCEIYTKNLMIVWDCLTYLLSLIRDRAGSGPSTTINSGLYTTPDCKNIISQKIAKRLRENSHF